MTARIHSVTLTLAEDIREDDAEQLLAGLRLFRGVIDVTPNVSSGSDHWAEVRVRADIKARLLNALDLDAKA